MEFNLVTGVFLDSLMLAALALVAWAALLGVVIVRGPRRRRDRRPAPAVGVTSAAVSPGPVPPVHPVSDDDWFAGPSPLPGGPSAGTSSTEDWFAPPAAPGAAPAWPSTAAGGPEAAPVPVPAAGARSRLPAPVAALAVIPVVLLLLALDNPWARVVAPGFAASTPVVAAVPATAVPDLLCVAALIVAPAAMMWRGAGLWALLAGTASLLATFTGVVALTLVGAASAVVAQAVGLAQLPAEASVEVGDACHFLAAGGLAGQLWALLAALLAGRARTA